MSRSVALLSLLTTLAACAATAPEVEPAPDAEPPAPAVPRIRGSTSAPADAPPMQVVMTWATALQDDQGRLLHIAMAADVMDDFPASFTVELDQPPPAIERADWALSSGTAAIGGLGVIEAGALEPYQTSSGELQVFDHERLITWIDLENSSGEYQIFWLEDDVTPGPESLHLATAGYHLMQGVDTGIPPGADQTDEAWDGVGFDLVEAADGFDTSIDVVL